MRQKIETVIEDDYPGTHINDHWCCSHTPVQGTRTEQINAGDMALDAEVMLAGLKSAQGGVISLPFFEGAIKKWEVLNDGH